jgi:hypothetical protein
LYPNPPHTLITYYIDVCFCFDKDPFIIGLLFETDNGFNYSILNDFIFGEELERSCYVTKDKVG